MGERVGVRYAGGGGGGGGRGLRGRGGTGRAKHEGHKLRTEDQLLTRGGGYGGCRVSLG